MWQWQWAVSTPGHRCFPGSGNCALLRSIQVLNRLGLPMHEWTWLEMTKAGARLHSISDHKMNSGLIFRFNSFGKGGSLFLRIESNMLKVLWKQIYVNSITEDPSLKGYETLLGFWWTFIFPLSREITSNKHIYIMLEWVDSSILAEFRVLRIQVDTILNVEFEFDLPTKSE